MRAVTFKLILLRLLALVGLLASAASLIDHLRPEPFFCGFESGCERVTRSEYGQPLGIPLPWFGVAAFALYLLVSLFPAHPVGKLLGPMSLLAGFAGMGLLVVQAVVLKELCPLCIVADASAMGLALVYLAIPQPAEGEPPRPWRWLWATLAVLALAAPWVADWLSPSPPVPDEVKTRWQSGKINVVVVTDFECPECRQTHPVLSELLRERAADVHVVRLVFPLPRHPNARPAARAYAFAQGQGQGPAMYEALFAADDLTPPALEKLVVKLGLDVDKYRAALADPAPLDKQIDDGAAWVPRVAAGKGLPLIWVQDRRLYGLQPADALRAALTRAAPAP